MFPIKMAIASLEGFRIDPPKDAVIICQTLNDNGFQAYIVGGCVRDSLLGKSPKDWDIASNAKPETVMKMFPKVIPTGIDHGTVTVMMHGEGYEVTVFRGDGEYTDGRKPDSIYHVDSIEEDLARRDFTINAIAYDPIKHTLIDPFNGLEDIKKKSIKAVGNPDSRFSEDSLRTLRAARFASKLGFDIDPETLNAIKNHRELITKLSKERVRDEIFKTLQTDIPSRGLKVLAETGIIDLIIPLLTSESLLSKMSLVDGSGFGENPILVKFTLLVSDYDTKKVETICKNLKMSADEVKMIVRLMEAKKLAESYGSTLTPVKARELVSKLQKLTPDGTGDKLIVNLFAFLKKLNFSNIDSFESAIKEAFTQPTSIKDLALNGQAIQAMGVPPGPKFGLILNELLRLVIEDPSLNTVERLSEIVKDLIGEDIKRQIYLQFFHKV